MVTRWKIREVLADNFSYINYEVTTFSKSLENGVFVNFYKC